MKRRWVASWAIGLVLTLMALPFAGIAGWLLVWGDSDPVPGWFFVVFAFGFGFFGASVSWMFLGNPGKTRAVGLDEPPTLHGDRARAVQRLANRVGVPLLVGLMASMLLMIDAGGWKVPFMAAVLGLGAAVITATAQWARRQSGAVPEGRA